MTQPAAVVVTFSEAMGSASLSGAAASGPSWNGGMTVATWTLISPTPADGQPDHQWDVGRRDGDGVGL